MQNNRQKHLCQAAMIACAAQHHTRIAPQHPIEKCLDIPHVSTPPLQANQASNNEEPAATWNFISDPASATHLPDTTLVDSSFKDEIEELDGLQLLRSLEKAGQQEVQALTAYERILALKSAASWSAAELKRGFGYTGQSMWTVQLQV
jgi:hypothetical protein